MRRSNPDMPGHSVGKPVPEPSWRVRRPGPSRRQVTAALSLLTTSGCTIFRLDPPPGVSAIDLPILGVENARFWPDGPPQAMLREAREMTTRQAAALGVSVEKLPPANFLALSGGGDNGAFGAGLLNGWTDRGSRPQFDIVTGISAGALIAPFAFLGPAYDTHLRDVFTRIDPSDVLRFRSYVLALLFGEALADTSPLGRLIDSFVDETMLSAIAQSYSRGRLLLIGTTNLDLQRPVVWNVGAIAASNHPGALSLLRRILLASASIPGAFPPVLVNVEYGGRSWQEMHVDGGAAAQVFLYPSSLNPGELGRTRALRRERTVWVVRNGRMDVNGASTNRGLLSIASRSVSTLLHFSGIGDVSRIYLVAIRDGLRFRLSYIGSEFAVDRREPFDPAYMQALFAYGYAKGRSAEAWVTSPPTAGTGAATDDAAPLAPQASGMP